MAVRAHLFSLPKCSVRAVGLLALAAILAGCGVATADQAAVIPTVAPDIFDPEVPNATPIPGVETFTITSSKHTTEPVDYAQDPPVGGPHDPSWQRCGIYDATIKPEHAVHSMEHGAVWITYRPDLPTADVESLTKLVGEMRYILLSPYPGLTEPVVASAWGAQLRLSDPRDPRLAEFIARYAGHGPEPGANCDSGVDSTLSG